MADLGYSDVSVLDGGIAAWESAGFRIYSGVHVPSKAFAEVVEHDLGTPWVTATELKALIDAGRDIAVVDSRSFAEYHTNSIPTAVSVPGGYVDHPVEIAGDDVTFPGGVFVPGQLVDPLRHATQ